MKRIGEYEVLGLLGRGGMSRVYKVRHDLGPVRALKLFAPRPELAALLPRQELLARFLDEARTLAGLEHPNLVRVLQVHGQEPVYYLMEHHCLSLAEVIGEGPRLEDPSRPVGVEDVLAWGGQALAGLGALHQAGVVHRDVKPANLMLADDGTVRLGDLGMSHRRGELFRGPANLVLGSPAYAAPEQEADPMAAGPWADIYSLGVSLFRLLAGRLPGPGLLVSQLHPATGPAWDAFLAQAMAPDSAQRFARASAMAEALDELGRQWEKQQEAACALPSTSPAAPAEMPGPPPRRSPERVRLAGSRQELELDELMRPRAWWPRLLEDVGQGVARDGSTGLLWQRSGSPQPLHWDQAIAYIQALNLRRMGGRGDWRLPTAPELMTLLGPPDAPGSFCGPPVLEPGLERLWSIDTATARAAWYANLAAGYLGRADRDCFLFVRAVAG